MFKFVVLFRQPTDIWPFEERYNLFLAQVETMPNILRRQVASVTGGPTGVSPFYRILEVYFEDRPAMEVALRSSEGQRAGTVLSHFPREQVEMLFAEVYEETGGSTPDHRE